MFHVPFIPSGPRGPAKTVTDPSKTDRKRQKHNERSAMEKRKGHTNKTAMVVAHPSENDTQCKKNARKTASENAKTAGKQIRKNNANETAEKKARQKHRKTMSLLTKDLGRVDNYPQEQCVQPAAARTQPDWHRQLPPVAPRGPNPKNPKFQTSPKIIKSKNPQIQKSQTSQTTQTSRNPSIRRSEDPQHSEDPKTPKIPKSRNTKMPNIQKLQKPQTSKIPSIQNTHKNHQNPKNPKQPEIHRLQTLSLLGVAFLRCHMHSTRIEVVITALRAVDDCPRERCATRGCADTGGCWRTPPSLLCTASQGLQGLFSRGTRRHCRRY